MTDSRLAVLVLAAGKGTRMISERPKVLHPVAGRTMLNHVLAQVEGLAPARIVVVVGPDMAAVEQAAVPHPCVLQESQNGTGDAVRVAREALSDFCAAGREILVVFGDTPLILPETLDAMVAGRRAAAAPDLVLLGFRPQDPTGYGRILQDAEGRPTEIVEERDADADQRAVGLCNGGLMLIAADRLFGWLDRVGSDNAKGEIYLTDLAAIATADGAGTALVEASEEEVMGIDTRAKQAVAEAVLQTRLRAAAMAGGATLVDPTTVWLSWDTRIGRDVTIQPSVFVGPGVTIGDGAEIRAFCHLEDATVASGAIVGPYARLRPGAVVGDGAHVGNFVEVKNATLHEGAKANHLTYIGDAEVGAGANVGAGTITCNYDGVGKYRTTIGPGAFIGSNTALVAPVAVGARAVVGAGSTITRDVPDDALGVGRGRQETRPGGAARLRELRSARKKEG